MTQPIPEDKTLSFDDFFERYAPLPNPYNPTGPLEGRVFRDYATEDGIERQLLERADPKTLWTLCFDEDSSYIVAGVTKVNREGILVSAIARTGGEEEELIFVQDDELEDET